MNLVRIATWSEVPDRIPTAAMAENVELVIVRRGDEHSVLHGRCLHRGALLADGHVQGDDLICGLHGWDYRIASGVSAYNNSEALAKFPSVLEDDGLFVDLDDVIRWKLMHPQPYSPDVYQGLYTDPHGTIEEPYVMRIHELAAHGLEKVGHHGFVAAMGVPRQQLPTWDDIQFVTAELARLPLLDEVPVGTEVCIGPNARQPLYLDIPLFVSDMSFGALSQEAKTALARGAQLAGTGICSGEGGMLPEEQAANSRYLYELASARFGWSWDVLKKVQAFHFKLGQGAKTGTGGHLPGAKVVGRIAEVRGLPEGTAAVSPPTFPDWHGVDDFRRFADEVRERANGIPIGAKLSAQHIEADIDAALQIGVDYIILDGRGGGTGAAPLLFRDHISVPTIPALARARRHLDQLGRRDVTLVITGGLRDAADFAKALSLGADAVAIANSAIQAIGCLGMRACHTDNCPVGIATQKPHLRARLPVDEASQRLDRFLRATIGLMQVLARACGHDHLSKLCLDDLTTFNREMTALTGIAYGGVNA
ncbi:MAG: methylamine---glutamate N-methyltransferase subunit [Actinomycetota bacterium]|nr:methylamine---glutamate N-methyltransferase subunit [Actinomycetota bacterium]